MSITVDGLCSAIDGDIFRNSERFACLSEDDTYEVISSILEPRIGVISCVEPSREHDRKRILKRDAIRIQESEGSDKNSQKEGYSQKEFGYLGHSVIMARKCFDHWSSSNSKELYVTIISPVDK